MPAQDIFGQLLRLGDPGNLGGTAGGAPPAGGIVGSATGQVVASWLGWAFVFLPLDQLVHMAVDVEFGFV